VNLQALVARTRGMIATPDATLAEHANPPPPIGVVMREHLVPLLVLNALANLLLLALLAPAEAGLFDDLGATILTLVGEIGSSLVGVWVTALIVRYHAARVGGSGDPRAAFVLTALAMSPLIVAGTVATLVALAGVELAMLLLLGAAAYGFVIIYRGSGPVLGVPAGARGRYIASVILTQMLLSFVLVTLIAMFLMPMPA
jgi:hypothetical protein